MKVLAATYRSLKNSRYTCVTNVIHFMKQRPAAKNIFILLIVLLSCTPFLSGCGGGKNTAEANITVTTNPASGSTQLPALGPFNLNVTITSPMPAQGVTIAIKATPDGSSTAYFEKSTSTTAKSNDFTITGQEVAKINVVYITVTSNSKSSNTWTGSYRYSAK